MSDGGNLRHIETRQDFGHELTVLRERAGLTVRTVSRLTEIKSATVGDYFSGAHLPSPSTLTKLLDTLGVTAPSAHEEWRDTLHRIRRRPGRRADGAAPPYRGLASYQPEDAGWFFGRDRLVALMLESITKRHGTRCGVVVVGPSGSGKSSAIRAGLIPRLCDSGYVVHLVTTGEHPRVDLAEIERVKKANGASPSAPVILVVDQFEETFTACNAEEERRTFIAELTAFPGDVVIGLRADYFDRLLAYPALAQWAQNAQVVIEPMTEPELRSAIEGPARKAHVEVEDGLVQLLLRDLEPGDDAGPGSVHDPGALPLLSHTLLALWQAGGRMTAAQYAQMGGIRGAIARTADEVYDALTADQQSAARRLLLRLVRIDDSGTTRRRVPRNDLVEDDAFDAVVEELVDRRLLSVDASTVQIAHDALLRGWPRLRDWIEDDRARLRGLQNVTDAAESWHREGREDSGLLRGGRLAAARQWLNGSQRDDLPQLVRQFYDASVLKEQRGARLMRGVVAGFAVISTLAVTASLVVLRQSAHASSERDNAVSRAAATSANVLRHTDPSLAMQVSVSAYRTAPTREALSSLLDASAAPTATRLVGATGPVHSVAFSPDHRRLVAVGADTTVRLWNVESPQPTLLAAFHGSDDTVTTAAWSADGRMLVTAGADRVVRRWDVSDPLHPQAVGHPLAGATDIVNTVAVSSDGTILAAGSADKTVHLWAVTDTLTPLTPPLIAPGGVNGVAFSPTAPVLAVASADATVQLWDLTDPRNPETVGAALAGAGASVNAVAFSPDGRTLAAGSSDTTVRLWNVQGSGGTATAQPLTGPAGRVYAVAFSPDGHLVAAACADDSVRVWDVSTGHLTRTLPHPGPVTTIAFGPEETLATAATDGVVRLWRLPTPVLTGAEAPVFTVAFGADGRTLAAGSGDGTVSMWDVADAWRPSPSAALTSPPGTARLDGTVTIGPSDEVAAGTAAGDVLLWRRTDRRTPAIVLHPTSEGTGAVESVAVSPDGTLVAAGHTNGGVQVWHASDGSTVATLPTTHSAATYSVVFSPSGRTLAAASADKTVWLWDLTDKDRPAQIGSPLTGPRSYAYHVAFSADGRTLAAGSADGSVRLWDTTDPHHPQSLGTALTGPQGIVYAVAFAADGRTLATANTDRTVWLWDLSDRRRPSVRAVLTGFDKSVFTVAFSPNGHTLAAGGQDRTVRLWETDPQAAAKHACTCPGTPITTTEWQRYFGSVPRRPPCTDRL